MHVNTGQIRIYTSTVKIDYLKMNNGCTMCTSVGKGFPLQLQRKSLVPGNEFLSLKSCVLCQVEVLSIRLIAQVSKLRLTQKTS